MDLTFVYFVSFCRLDREKTSSGICNLYYVIVSKLWPVRIFLCPWGEVHTTFRSDIVIITLVVPLKNKGVSGCGRLDSSANYAGISFFTPARA